MKTCAMLDCCSQEKNAWIDLPGTYTKENLPVGDENVATRDIIKD